MQKQYPIDQVWSFHIKEMVREWNGSFVHVSEFEPKQPQLEPKTDSYRWMHKVYQKLDLLELNLLHNLCYQDNPFAFDFWFIKRDCIQNQSHGRSTSDVVRFRNVQGSPGGLSVYSI